MNEICKSIERTARTPAQRCKESAHSLSLEDRLQAWSAAHDRERSTCEQPEARLLRRRRRIGWAERCIYESQNSGRSDALAKTW